MDWSGEISGGSGSGSGSGSGASGTRTCNASTAAEHEDGKEESACSGLAGHGYQHERASCKQCVRLVLVAVEHLRKCNSFCVSFAPATGGAEGRRCAVRGRPQNISPLDEAASRFAVNITQHLAAESYPLPPFNCAR
jgi:hypothetical protein